MAEIGSHDAVLSHTQRVVEMMGDYARLLPKVEYQKTLKDGEFSISKKRLPFKGTERGFEYYPSVEVCQVGNGRSALTEFLCQVWPIKRSKRYTDEGAAGKYSVAARFMKDIKDLLEAEGAKVVILDD